MTERVPNKLGIMQNSLENAIHCSFLQPSRPYSCRDIQISKCIVTYETPCSAPAVFEQIFFTILFCLDFLGYFLADFVHIWLKLITRIRILSPGSLFRQRPGFWSRKSQFKKKFQHSNILFKSLEMEGIAQSDCRTLVPFRAHTTSTATCSLRIYMIMVVYICGFSTEITPKIKKGRVCCSPIGKYPNGNGVFLPGIRTYARSKSRLTQPYSEKVIRRSHILTLPVIP